MLPYVKTSLHRLLAQKDYIDNMDVIFVLVKCQLHKLMLGPPGQSSNAGDKLTEQVTEFSCHCEFTGHKMG